VSESDWTPLLLWLRRRVRKRLEAASSAPGMGENDPPLP
jgi:hypothetical protein